MADPAVGRRRFLGGTAAVAAALAVGGCRDDPEPPVATAPDGEGGPNAGDVDLLVAMGQIEHGLAVAFGALADARPEEVAALGLAERIAHHATAHDGHADLLADAVSDGGSDPRSVATPFAGMELPDEDDLVDLPIEALLATLRRTEEAAAATAADAVARVSQADLRGLLAEVAAADAGLAQALVLARGGLAALQLGDVVDGLLPLDASYLAG